MLVQQKQIAEKAGVSYATVSRAFTNSAKVNPQTMQRIRNAMTGLGITNVDDIFLGKSLLRKTVLVVVGDLASEFYSTIIKGLYAVLEPQGYMLVLCNSDYDSAKEIEAMKRAQNDGFAGIVMITATESDELIGFLHETSVPTLLVNRNIRYIDLDTVRIDNYRGGYMAAEYLIERGHTRIVHASGDRNSEICRDRIRGFSDAMRDHGIPVRDSDIRYCGQLRKGGREFAKKLLAGGEDYTAIFFSNTVITQGAMEVFTMAGKKLPDDYSVLTFDDSAILSEEGLGITTLSCDPMQMGRTSGSIYLRRLEDPLGDRIKTILSPRLTERGSVKNLLFS